VLDAFQLSTPDERISVLYGDKDTEGLTLAPQFQQETSIYPSMEGRTPLEGPDLGESRGMSVANETIPPEGDPRRGAGTDFLTKELPAAAIGIGLPLAAGAMLPAAAGLLARTGTAMAANVGARKLNQAVGFESGSPLTLDTTDALNAALPLAGAGWELGSRYVTKPGRAALETFDTLKGDASQKTAEQMAAWEQEGQEIRRKVQADMNKVNMRTDLSNDKKVAEYQRLAQAYQQTAQQHLEARTGLLNVPNAIATQDYKTLYAQVPKDVEVPLLASRNAAQNIVSEIDMRFPGFKDSALYHKAKGIVNYGKAAEEELDPAIAAQMRNRGHGPLSGEAPQEPRFEEAQKLLSDVGALKATAEARDSNMRGLIKQLDKALFQDIEATGAPGSALAEANRAYSTSRSKNDLVDLIGGGIRERAADNTWQVNPDKIRAEFAAWLEDPFTIKNFSEQQRENMAATVRDITNIPRLKTPPGPMGPLSEPDYSRITAKVQGAPPEPIPGPEAPIVENPSFGKLIAGRIVGGTIAGTMAGHEAGSRAGLNPYESTLVGGVAGVGAMAAPELISKLLVSGPRGQAILRNVMAGHHVLTPAHVAAMAGAARGLSGE
jgi:hypothetical protein